MLVFFLPRNTRDYLCTPNGKLSSAKVTRFSYGFSLLWNEDLDLLQLDGTEDYFFFCQHTIVSKGHSTHLHEDLYR